MDRYLLLLIPVLSMLLGWGIIRLAFYFLFHPVAPARFAGIQWQGIIPKQREALAAEAGNMADTWLSGEGFSELAKNPGHFETVRPLIEAHMDDFLRNKLKEKIPMIGMLIGDKTILTLKTIFIEEIAELFPQVMGQFAGNIQKNIQIGPLVTSRLLAIPPDKIIGSIEPKLRKSASQAAKYGAVLGFIIGLLQLLIVWFVGR